MFEKYLNSTFFKNVVKVFSGTSISQLFPMVGYFFIMRLFQADQFGIYAVWLGIISIISMISTLKLEQIFAIEYIKNNQTKAFSYVTLVSFTLSIILSCIVCTILLLTGYKNLSLIFFIFTLLATFVTSILRLYECYFVALSKFNMLIKLRMVNNFFIPFAQIIFGIYYQSFSMLILGYLAGSLLALIFCFVKTDLKVIRTIDYKGLKSFITSYKDIPSLKLPADFINNFAQQAPTFIVSFRFGSEYAGFLALTIKFLGAPLGIIGRAISDVFRPLLIQAIELKGNCVSELKEVSVYLLITSILSVLIIYPFGIQIFQILFGDEWTTSGYYASILSLLFAFRMMASPVSYILTAYRKVGVELIIQSFLLVLVVSSFFLSKEMNQSILIYSILGSIGYLIYYSVSLYYSFGTNMSNKNDHE